jgi:hypothetical protein
VRALQRRLSNLSQASTLVKSEYNNDLDPGTSSTAQVIAQHYPAEQIRTHKHCVQQNAAVSAGSADTILQDFDEARETAQERMRAMHMLLDISMDSSTELMRTWAWRRNLRMEEIV